MAKYKLNPVLKTIKQSFYLEYDKIFLSWRVSV